MKFLDRYLMLLEPPQDLTPKELYKLGYMWAPEEDLLEEGLPIITGPDNYESFLG
jgi:hypothetical protein